MSESLKGLAREEVAARRAALTDGRWRNREGIGMYQRSTSNALRNILTGVKGALPSLGRARSKSRSRSISPKKRASLVSGNHAESPKAGPSRLDPDPSPARPGPSPARSARSRRSSIRSRRNSSAAITSTTLLSPRAGPSPGRQLKPSPLRKSYPSPIRPSNPSPVRGSNLSPVRELIPSPVRQSTPPPVREPKPSPVRKLSTNRRKPQVKSNSKLKINKGKEPELSIPDSPKGRRESAQSVQAPEDDNVSLDESPPYEVENEPAAAEDPEPDHSTSIHPDVDVGGNGDVVDESVVVFEEDLPPKVPKDNRKKKEKANNRIERDTTAADESVVVPEESIPEPPPPKKKSRIQTIVPEVVKQAKPAQSRKASGSKRPATEDDDERAEGSPPKRAKNNKGKAKAKAPAKKGKTIKAKPRKKAETIPVDSEPESERATPAPQDIMVPLQDSPPPRPKDSKRRRYTLMPVRTKEQMAHPDYDPIDCIGWQ